MPSLRPSICLLLLTVFWAAIYLPALGRRELQGEEARRVLPGRTMMQTGEWIVPRSGGEVYNRKPPLVNWMSAAAISVTGKMDEWTVRTPSTLMILALALSMFLCLRGWLGANGALMAALIALTNIGFIEKGRLIEIEALYMSLYGIAMVAWLGLRWRDYDLAAWVVSGLVLGLGFLAKGPPHVLYFYAIVIGVLVAEKKTRDLWQWKHFVGLACFIGVWAPWAMLNSARNPQKDSGKVWAEQITHRLGFVEFDFVHYLLQIPQSLVNFLPWVILLPLCWKLYRGGEDRHAQWMNGMRRGLFWAFLIIAILPSSRPRFMLPLNVVAAIIVADALIKLSRERWATLGKWWLRVMRILVQLALGGLIIAPLDESGWSIKAWSALGLSFGLISLADWWLSKQKRDEPMTWVLTTSLALAAAIITFSFVTLHKNPWQDELRDFATSIKSKTGETAPILLYKVGERMWPFYLGQRCYESATLRERPRGIDFHWLVVAKKAWDKADEREELEKRFGKAKSTTPLREPHGKVDYVLVETTP